MPTKPLVRLMFAQGNECFFCKQPLPKAEASVEHLVASANGGSDSDDNCVACCKSVNALFGSMSLKEKFAVVLNQKGQFKCPNRASSKKAVAQANILSKPLGNAKQKESKFEQVVSNLRQRGGAKPRTVKTLASTIVSLFPNSLSKSELDALLQELVTRKIVILTGDKVSYSL